MSVKRNVPKLRFDEFIDPWKFVSLGEITTLITKGTTPKQFVDGEITFVKIESLKGQNIEKSQCSYIDETTHLGELKRSILEEGDILFAIAGATVGKIGMVQKEILPANTNQALAIIRLAKKETGFFMLQVLTSRVMKNYIYKSISVGAQPNLSLKQISDFSFISPSLPEQQKIAEFLTAVDQRIELLQAKKEKLEAYKKSVMQNIFSQQLRFKADDGSEFPDWEERKLGEIIQFSKGKGLPKSDITDAGPLKCIHYGELFTKYKEHITHIKSRTFEGQNMTLSKKNDVLMPTSDVTPNGLATASCIKETGVILGGDILILRQKVMLLDGIFLAYFISQNRKEVMRRVAGSTVYHLYGSDMKTIMVQVPTLEEQKKIVSFLTSLDSTIDNLNQQINQTQTWKKGLLQKMFV